MCKLRWQEKLSPNNLGQMTEHAKQFIQSGDPFKIGITSNPEQRRYGYRHNYDEMIVVLRTESPLEARLAERALIEKLSDSDNIDPGGGGPLGERPYFVYVVRGTPRETRPNRGELPRSRRRDLVNGSRTQPRENSGGTSPWALQCIAQHQQAKREARKRQEEQAVEEAAELITGLFQMAANAFGGSSTKDRQQNRPRQVHSWQVTRVDDEQHQEWNVQARTMGEAADKLRQWRKVKPMFMDSRKSGDA